MNCPVCRAAIDSASQCRRCRADLTLVRSVEDARSRLLVEARSRLAAVRLAPLAKGATVAAAPGTGATGFARTTQFVGGAAAQGQVVTVGAAAFPRVIPSAETTPALETAERAHRLRPDAETRRLLAVAHLLRRDFARAWRYYQQQHAGA
jgi:hypothetical protein